MQNWGQYIDFVKNNENQYIQKIKPYFQNQLQQYNVEGGIDSEQLNTLLSGKISRKQFLEEDLFTKTKLLPPNITTIQEKENPQFADQFKNHIFPNFSIFEFSEQNSSYDKNNLFSETDLYELGDLEKNKNLKIQEKIDILSVQICQVPYLIEEDEFCGNFEFFYMQKDIEQLYQYGQKFITLLDLNNSNISEKTLNTQNNVQFSFSSMNFEHHLKQISIDQNKLIYQLYLNNIPDEEGIFYSLIQSFYQGQVLHIRHEIQMFQQIFDMERNQEGTGEISMILMDGISGNQQKNAQRNVRRFIWSMFRCASFQEIKDFTGLSIDSLSKSYAMENSYTQSIFNQWNRPDFYDFDQLDSKNQQKKLHRFQQFLADIFLECSIPPQKIFEEYDPNSISAVYYKNPVPSPLNMLFFVQIINIVAQLKRFPIHLISDFLTSILNNGKLIQKRPLQPQGLPLDPVTEKPQTPGKLIDSVNFLKLDLIYALKCVSLPWLPIKDLKINIDFNQNSQNQNNEKNDNQNNILLENVKFQQFKIPQEKLKIFKLYSCRQYFPMLAALIIPNSLISSKYSPEYIQENNDGNEIFNIDFYGQTDFFQQLDNHEQKVHLISCIEHQSDNFILNLPENSKTNDYRDFSIILIRVDFWRRICSPIKFSEIL